MFFKKKKNEKNELKENSTKVVEYGYKDLIVSKFKEANAIVITAFLWMLRLVFVPSLLFMVTSWFAVNMTPTLAIEVYKVSGLSKDSPLTDQFAFFYLPMVAYLFIFGIVIVVLLCYTEYRFWKKCGLWIKYWYAKTNIKNPFKMFKN